MTGSWTVFQIAVIFGTGVIIVLSIVGLLFVSGVNMKFFIRIGLIGVVGVVVLILIESTAYKCSFGPLNPYISDMNIVYTPTKPAYRFHRWYWIDIYDYSVFRLSNREEKIILKEAENGKWSEMTLNHIDKIDSMEYREFLDFSYRYHKCYVCIYDIQHDEIITDSENYIPYDTTQWVIFLYDTLANKYYCVFQTI